MRGEEEAAQGLTASQFQFTELFYWQSKQQQQQGENPLQNCSLSACFFLILLDLSSSSGVCVTLFLSVKIFSFVHLYATSNSI
jgi:hypothetical protein